MSTSNMAALGTVVLLPVSLILEVMALSRPKEQPLKIMATWASVSSLLYFLACPPPGTFMTLWPLGMNIFGLAQRCINYLWLEDPAQFHRKEKAVVRDGKDAELKAHGSCLDALDIATTFRGVGWSFEAKGLPQPSVASPIVFAASQVAAALGRFLILDLAISYANAFVPSLVNASIPLRLAFGCLMMFYVRWTMDIPCRILSALAVLFLGSSPASWPPLFGSWSEAYTIRRFWSHTWHQGMRLIAEAPVNFVVHSLLGLQKGTYISQWSKIFGNFMMAFLDHAYGRVMGGGDVMNDWNMFILHPIALWLEETTREVLVAAGILSKDKRSKTERYLGYLWVGLFNCGTFLYFMEGAIRVEGNVPAPAEGLIEPPFGASLVLPIMRWITASMQ